MATKGKSRRSGGRRRATTSPATPARQPEYRRLKHPFAPQAVFNKDEVAGIHAAALRVLAELGIRILLPEARDILRRHGARVDHEEMVFIGGDMVAEALRTAPSSIRLRAANPLREQTYEPGAFLTMAGAGCPNATDLRRGRRPGDLNSFVETTKLVQRYDVLHMLGPTVEPQDVPVHLRHYAMLQGQLEYSDKPLFVYSRGSGQVNQSFEMIQIALDLSDSDFRNGVWATSVINSNSPRLLDRPMAQGLMDFALHGQMSIITPFCLAGAMAPITVAGALTLQHAEALAAIVLVQMTRPGAPISYGGFSSNVDMKSGAPAFGTPEHVKMQLGTGQMARHIGLPWRSAAGAASNLADAQGATETAHALWGAMMANATLTVHAAGWLEGGLSFGYEKFINDIETLQTLAELCGETNGSDDDIGFDAIAEVPPGGHFFATRHTMDRYSTAFYSPLVATRSSFGAWEEAGAKSAEERARAIWERDLETYRRPASGLQVRDRLADYIARATDAGGAPPME